MVSLAKSLGDHLKRRLVFPRDPLLFPPLLSSGLRSSPFFLFPFLVPLFIYLLTGIFSSYLPKK